MHRLAFVVAAALVLGACDQAVPVGGALPEGEIRQVRASLAQSGLVGGLLGSLAGLQCSNDADCQTATMPACKAPFCDPTLGTCWTKNVADGTHCDDGNVCTRVDACQGGVCTGTKPVVCGVSDQCHDLGVCDPQTGKCSDPAKAPGSACSDGDPCTYGEICGSDGACRGGTAITCSNDTCNKRSCNGTSACIVTPQTASSCDDGNLCTYGDVCDATGKCGGTVIVCADDSFATRTCNGTSTCTVTPKPGASCDDGDPCTQGDVLQANGSCAGMPYLCPVKDCLLSSACDGRGGCTSVAKPDGTTCDADGSKCTPKDICQAGACKPDPNPVRCVARDCNTVTCNGATGSCDYAPTTGGACGVSGCYGSGVCTGGICSGTPKDCSAMDGPCTTGICDVVTGDCVAADKPNGASCNPGGMCAAGAVCAFGACELAPATCPDATGPCRIPACNPDDGKCIETSKPAGAACDPGNSCVSGATCDDSGNCAGVATSNGQACTGPGGAIGRCAIGTCNVNGTNNGDDAGGTTDAGDAAAGDAAAGDDGGPMTTPGSTGGGCCAIAPERGGGGAVAITGLLLALVLWRRRGRDRGRADRA